MKLPYIKEMSGHIPKEINGFLKKLVFKVTFILINKTFNLTLYYSTVGLLKPTLVTNTNYLNLVRNENLNFPDFSCLFFPIMMKLFLFIQHKGFKRKMGVFDKFLKILPISSFWCKILISCIIFLIKIKRIRVNWCPRLDGLQ